MIANWLHNHKVVQCGMTKVFFIVILILCGMNKLLNIVLSKGVGFFAQVGVEGGEWLWF